jgi:hypothetical protein
MMVRVASFSRSTTRLSRFGAHLAGRYSGFLALARLSLVAVLPSMLPGCLVDDPPPYVAPQETAPRLDYTEALPGLDQLLVASYPDLITFEMPFTSEDAGEQLYAVLWLDYDGVEGEQLNSRFFPPSTLADTSRRVLSLTWKVQERIVPGCHRFTLRVSHVGNTGTSPDVFDKNDLAEAYWLANLNVTAENANSLVNCPQASTRRTP